MASSHTPHCSRLSFPHFMPRSSLCWQCTWPFSVPTVCLVQLKLWIDEKMLTAQDVSYDEARNLHTKWQKHQAFMAELAANKDWLDKVDKVHGATGAARGESLWPPQGRVPATVQGRTQAPAYGSSRVGGQGASHAKPPRWKIIA